MLSGSKTRIIHPSLELMKLPFVGPLSDSIDVFYCSRPLTKLSRFLDPHIEFRTCLDSSHKISHFSRPHIEFLTF
jgi:hypothetical protein